MEPVAAIATQLEQLSLDSTEEWRKYLKEAWPNLEAPSLLKRFISKQGQKIPFEPLDETKEAIATVISKNESGGFTKNDRVVGLLKGSPGSGKTRSLVQLGEYVNDTHVFLVSFNNGNPPRPFDAEVGAEVSISLRLIHSVHAGHVSFDEFVALVKKAGLLKNNNLTFANTFTMLTQHVKAKRRIVAVDEFNELMGKPQFNDYVQEFSEVLGEMSKRRLRPIFFVAATTSLDLEAALRNSKVDYAYIPLVPFALENQSNILDRYAATAPELRSWRKYRKFRMLLALIGGLPRCFEYLLEELEKWKMNPMPDWYYEGILGSVRSAAQKYILPEKFALQLVEDVVLQTEVRPEWYVPGHNVTYEELQMTCNILLIPRHENAIVFISYMTLSAVLASPAAAAHPVLVRLRDLLHGGAELRWQHFEEFVLEYECVRTMLFKQRCDRLGASGVTLSEYYGCRAFSENIPTLLDCVSMDAEETIKSCYRFPIGFKDREPKGESVTELVTCAKTGREHQVLESTAIFLNGEGAPFADIFRLFQMDDGARLVLLLQCKWLQVTELDQKAIAQELEKNKQCMDRLRGKPTWADVADFTVIIASKLKANIKQVGQQHLVLGPAQFSSYFGRTLQDRALYLSSTKLHINTASYQELLSIPNVGRVTARKILAAVHEVNEGIRNESELCERANISAALATNFEF
ncbi:hypothetical protein BC832DRAFT_593178 [Gaertneriomyces semiglobifer]|nr:hypothetical protein BC832DRAFT_593178 [Gaertneriomyces semiglobifer]